MNRAERRILVQVAGALVGESVGDAVADAAAPLLRRLPRSDRRLFSLLLRFLEYGAPLFTGRPGRFTALAPGRQTAYLRRWSESRIPLLRQAAGALKALVMLAHYGSEDAWADVGYDGPWLGRVDVPVLSAPDLRIAAGSAGRLTAGVTLGRELDGDPTLRAQVCVIGTGAGGAAALARLAERGVDAIAVEAGGHPTAADFTQRELDMLPLLYQDAGLRATADKAIGILQGRGLGGSTLHNTGLVHPPPSGIVGRWHNEHGLALNDADLDRYVAEAMDTLHATPIPDDRINANNETLRRGAAALGWRHRVALHNREECSGCGYCMLGCAYNRKYNAALTYLPRAVAAGARILGDARAVRIERRNGMRRVACELTDSEGRSTGRRATIEADVVVVAAGALDTPALLLRSRLGSNRVGRGLRLHPAALVAGAFHEKIEAWRGLPQAVLVDEFATFIENGHGGFIIIPISGWPGITAALVPGIGEPHRKVIREFPYLASAAVLLHDETEGRVTATRAGRPIAHYWPDARDREELARGVAALARLYLAAGAVRVHLPYADAPVVRTERELNAAIERARPVPHRFSLNSVHPQGSCPLGTRRERSALDPHGELWDEPGIFVADTSVFPTSVGVPPQVTTMALATATAEYIFQERL